MNKFYITATIPYVNAKPHIGHALEFVQTDVLARYYRQKGDDVYFLTGSDENSLKNVLSAEKEGLSTQELVDKYSRDFKDLKQVLNLSWNQFIKTSEKRHFIGAQKLWSACKKEDIYKKSYAGLYCVGCEEFKKEADLIDGVCPEHKTKCEKVEEENYFFRLSNYQGQLAKLVQSDQLKIVPETRKNEVLSFIKSGLEDFSISRSVKRAKGWGVPVPNDLDQIMYVWFDALSNYITALGYGSKDEKLLQKFWPADLHVIGKGVIRFHTIYWPAMLLSAGLKLPKSIFVHGYVTVEGEKISKSIGNVVDPKDVVDKYGTDALRYYLLKEISPYSDGDFSWKRLEEVYNSELANELGNLVNRVVTMVNRYDIKLKTKNEKLKAKSKNPKLDKLIEEFRFNEALEEIWEEIRNANRYIEETKPWELAKTDKKKLEKVIQELTYRLWLIAYGLSSFLPETSEKIQKQLKTLKPNVLFPRIDK